MTDANLSMAATPAVSEPRSEQGSIYSPHNDSLNFTVEHTHLQTRGDFKD